MQWPTALTFQLWGLRVLLARVGVCGWHADAFLGLPKTPSVCYEKRALDQKASPKIRNETRVDEDYFPLLHLSLENFNLIL